MNLILFEPAELSLPLPRSDRRAHHLLTVLRRGIGDSFDAGVVNGPKGKASLTDVTDESITLSFAAQSDPPLAEPITLIVGLPRPQTARDILRDATSLGVAALHFVVTEKSDPNYAQSTLWSSGEWRRLLIAGAEQAFTTRIPDVTSGRTLAEVIAAQPIETTRLALDNYESATPLSESQLRHGRHLLLALGSERGWGAADRTVLRTGGFEFRHLGTRVLRTETACTAALAIVRAKLGLM